MARITSLNKTLVPIVFINKNTTNLCKLGEFFDGKRTFLFTSALFLPKGKMCFFNFLIQVGGKIEQSSFVVVFFFIIS